MTMDRTIYRTTSTASRRSVKVMKSLLPLKLSSPRLQSPRSPSPVPSLRSDFETPLTPPTLRPIPLPILQRRPDHNSKPATRLPMKLRSDKYRDTPYFTPKLDLIYLARDEICLSCSPTGSSCDESCIFQDYASLDNSDSSLESDFEDDECRRGLGFEFWQANPHHDARKRPRNKSSDLSIKCRGEFSSSEKPMFADEAAWLSSSPLTKPRTSKRLPRLPPKHRSVEHELDGWLSDSSSQDDEDELVCSCFSVVSSLSAYSHRDVQQH